MSTKSQLIIGSAPGCDLLVQGPGVAPRHAQLMWRDGLWVQDLAQGRTEVDGRPLFSKVDAAQITTQPGVASARWTFKAELKRTETP